MDLEYQDRGRFLAGLPRRRIIISSISSAICVVAIAFWIRSYSIEDELMYTQSSIGVHGAQMVQEKLFPSQGAFGIVYCKYQSSDSAAIEQTRVGPPDGIDHFTYSVAVRHPIWCQIAPGFDRSSDPETPSNRWQCDYFILRIPYWMVVALFAIYPITAVRQWIRHR